MSIVLADGCFDPFHIGHLRYLQAVNRLAHQAHDVVINVASDDEIRAKGRKPFQTLDERKALVSQWGTAVISEPLAQAIADRRPAYLVKGIEWEGRLPMDVVQACRRAFTAIVYTQTRCKSSTERLKA
jgi:cytidyltransferase-like protein